MISVPTEHVYLNRISSKSSSDPCAMKNCLSLIEGEPLDIQCAADGYPRPSMEIQFDRNGTMPTIMALAHRNDLPENFINEQFRPTIYETYRILGLTSADNGRNLSCQVDMKSIEKKLSKSITKPLFIQCECLDERSTEITSFSSSVRPRVAEKAKKIFVGINQTRTVNCTVLEANPNTIHYAIQGLSPNVQRRIHATENDLLFTFDLTPTSIEQFRPFNITANNSIGIDTCSYELIHGGNMRCSSVQQNHLLLFKEFPMRLHIVQSIHQHRT